MVENDTLLSVKESLGTETAKLKGKKNQEIRQKLTM